MGYDDTDTTPTARGATPEQAESGDDIENVIDADTGSVVPKVAVLIAALAALGVVVYFIRRD